MPKSALFVVIMPYFSDIQPSTSFDMVFVPKTSQQGLNRNIIPAWIFRKSSINFPVCDQFICSLFSSLSLAQHLHVHRARDSTVGIHRHECAVGGPLTHCPHVLLHEIISWEILGSPHQRLRLVDIHNAIQEQFRYVVLQDPSWLVSGMIIL